MLDLLTLLKRHAHSPSIALRSATDTLTHRALWARVSGVASWLEGRSEQRIGLALENSFDWVIWDLACLQVNKVLIPIPSFFSAQQQQNVLLDSGAELLVGTHLDATLYEHLVNHGQPMANDSCSVLKLAKAPTSTALPKGTQKITYTSGSTGQPKGVCLSADGIAIVVDSLLQRLPSQLNSTHLVVMPLAVLLENIAGVYVTLALGAEVILLANHELGLMGASGLDAERFVKSIVHNQISTLVVPPALLEVICAAVEHWGVPARQFEFIAVGGARLASSLEQRAMDLRLPVVVGYGLSECASVVSLNNIQAERPLGSVGTLLPHVSTLIHEGELFIKNPLMLGYLGESGRTDDWFATGDLAHFDESGHLYIDGRKKNIIVTPYGRNVDPEWLETELATHPAIEQVCVSGDESSPLRALIVSQAADETIEAFIQTINATLPDYARIKTMRVLTQPFTVANQQLTGTGRLRRQAILKQYPLSESSTEY